MVILNRNSDLPDVVDAFCTPRRLAGRLDRRKQERDQNPDDRDYHQQLNERKSASAGFATSDTATSISFQVMAAHMESMKEKR